VTEGGSGFFAVLIWWNAEDPVTGGFWEPWDTGIGRYATVGEAAVEARDWAEAEELAYWPPKVEQS
jgi:hypothetical protein